jgi:hypothetical protein
LHLVGVIIRIYHYARSPERQIRKLIIHSVFLQLWLDVEILFSVFLSLKKITVASEFKITHVFIYFIFSYGFTTALTKSSPSAHCWWQVLYKETCSITDVVSQSDFSLN